jgi:hypothetical protein
MRVRDGVLWPAPRRTLAAAPVLGLALLALPLVDWLPFHAGDPLRVLTAQACRWLLASAFTVQREGGRLLVDGQLVIVDALGSGAQMAWAGCFTACAVALLKGCSSRSFLSRLPLAVLAALAADVLRNTSAAALQASGRGTDWMQPAAGLIALAVMCGSVAALMGRVWCRK